MSLRIGIENGLEKGFTEKELELTNSFPLGVLSMLTGIGRINGDEKNTYRTHISVQEAHDRFTIGLVANGDIFTKLEEVKEMLTLDFVQRMADADWSCNVSNESKEEFLYKMAGQVMTALLNDNRTETLGTYYYQTPWSNLQSRELYTKRLVGSILAGDSDEYVQENVDSVIESYEFNYSKRFYDNKYLHWNEDTAAYSLSHKVQEE